MKNNIQFALILCLFGYIIFLQQCGKGGSPSQHRQATLDTIISFDTVLPPPIIVKLPRQEIPEPIIVYIDSSNRQVSTALVDTNTHQATRFYQDSLEDENLTLFYSSLVDGQLLQNNIDYKLKIPKLITKTIEIPKPYPIPTNGFFLNAGVGGNPRQFSSITVGLQFIGKKGWAVGYDYDILQNVHQVKLGFRLWHQKQ